MLIPITAFHRTDQHNPEARAIVKFVHPHGHLTQSKQLSDRSGDQMIIRTYTACPACEAPMMLRVGVGYAPRHQIAVACNRCGSPIRGELNTEGDWPRVLLPGMLELNGSEHIEWQVITLHADFPIPEVSWESSPSMETMFSPFLISLRYLGDRDTAFFDGMARFRALASMLDDYQRTYGLHIRRQWDLVNRNLKRQFDDWPAGAEPIECQHMLHGMLYMGISVIDPAGMYPSVKEEIWSRTFKKAEPFAQEAWRADKDGALRRLQNRISEQLFFLLRHADQWSAAIPIIYARENQKITPENWRIPGDSFSALRDAYRQNFELSCQALSLTVRMQNISEGREASVLRSENEAEPWIPKDFPSGGKAKPPSTIKQFEKMNSATKELYLNRSKNLRRLWNSCFERSLRNSISHADADYDLRSGIILTTKGAKSYHDFLVSIAQQVPLLALWLDLIKLWRIYALQWDPVNCKLVKP